MAGLRKRLKFVHKTASRITDLNIKNRIVEGGIHWCGSFMFLEWSFRKEILCVLTSFQWQPEDCSESTLSLKIKPVLLVAFGNYWKYGP